LHGQRTIKVGCQIAAILSFKAILVEKASAQLPAIEAPAVTISLTTRSHHCLGHVRMQARMRLA
jgi:hypothetical protein